MQLVDWRVGEPTPEKRTWISRAGDEDFLGIVGCRGELVTFFQGFRNLRDKSGEKNGRSESGGEEAYKSSSEERTEASGPRDAIRSSRAKEEDVVDC